ncbi:mrna capping enzyme [Plasmopara halstedii]|uniref:Mrna capping enzyme n=1 Tax=Plasmopara halstedii TaxID=4781 RepID=A0A0P1ANP6_PLAHL|nr:mrna capping enzyme [Plasmopara halstedii]CEG43064.1 mrna capping enzyme [Plasmopara halstedii]|eukprot:XP_024579433.1 mrna capping enzyme [Plasmopara halstedii]
MTVASSCILGLSTKVQMELVGLAEEYSPSYLHKQNMTSSVTPVDTQSIAGIPVELGQPVHVNTKKQLQRQINAIVAWSEVDRAPVNVAQTMVRGNEHQIGEHPYFVCEKSVGVRYLALLVQGRCYLIAQNYDIREVALFCPVRPDRLQPGADRNTVVPHQWTILDGLMVCDKDGTKSVLTLLLYDILALNGSPVMTSKLQDRLKLIQNDVVGPRKQLLPPKGQPPDMFQLVLQSMYPINRVGHVIHNIIPRVSQTRQNAGLLFTPVLLPYTPGHSKGLFQWTPMSLLCADFQLGVEWRGRPPKPGFKLMIHDKRTQIFHDWITFTADDFEAFRQDKKASSRILECVYDPDWLTYIPSHDKSTWEIGNAEFNATERGLGWRKGGWKYVRSRPDRSMPYERIFLAIIEKAINEDIKLDEIERFFPEDTSKKTMSLQQKNRHDAPLTSEDNTPPNKKKRGNTNTASGQNTGTGVCYDFQNKGVCQRGRFCHFSHCACNSTCSCTPTKNTYGQRPSYRRNDYDAPPSPELVPSIGDASGVPDKTSVMRHTNSLDRNFSMEIDGNPGEEGEAGELTDNGNLHMKIIFAPLEHFDKETIAAKRAQLTALGNRRIWASLGLEDKPQRTRPCGLIVSKSGEVVYVRPLEK